MMRIDLALLTHLDACAKHRAAFAAAFPDGLIVTGEPDADAIACIVAANLDVYWLCDMVLTAPAYAAYDKAVAPAYVAYHEAVATADASCREATAIARAAYDEAVATASAAYREAVATAAWRFLSNPDNIRSEYRQ